MSNGVMKPPASPSTATLSNSRARRAMSSICGRCTCMPLTNTTSAQEKSSSLAGAIFSSTNRTDQDGGTAAAITSRPCGGMKALMSASG